MQKTFSTKNISFSKHGAAISCPRCGKAVAYKIGELDREEWALVNGKYRCKECRALPPHDPVFPRSIGAQPAEEEKEDIDKLLEMI